MIRRPPRSPLFPTPTLSQSIDCPDDVMTVFSQHAITRLALAQSARRLCLSPPRLENARQEQGQGQEQHQTRQASKKPSTTPFRSEEHTSELQSQSNLVCRLL